MSWGTARGMGRDPDRTRLAVGTVMVGGLALALTGCGIQSTAVHSVPIATPISAGTGTPSASSAPAGMATFPVQIFLTSHNQLVPVTRYIAGKPSPQAILDEFTKPLTKEEFESGYATAVPTDLRLTPSVKLAHLYTGSSTKPLVSPGPLQIICSLDVYWYQHPDGLNPSTELVVNGQTTSFDDCQSYAQEALVKAGPLQTAAKPGAPVAVPSTVKSP